MKCSDDKIVQSTRIVSTSPITENVIQVKKENEIENKNKKSKEWKIKKKVKYKTKTFIHAFILTNC